MKKTKILLSLLILFFIAQGANKGNSNYLVPTTNISTSKLYELVVEEVKTTPQDDIQLGLKFISLSKEELKLSINHVYLDVYKTVVINGKKLKKDVAIEAEKTADILLKSRDKAWTTVTFRKSEASYIHAIKGGSIKIGSEKFSIPALKAEKKEPKKTTNKSTTNKTSDPVYLTRNLSLVHGLEAFVTSVTIGRTVHLIDVNMDIINKRDSEILFNFVSTSINGHTSNNTTLSLAPNRIEPVNSSFRKADGKIGIPGKKTMKLKVTFQIPVNNTKIIRVTDGIINFNNPGEVPAVAQMFCLPNLNVQ